MARRYNSPSFRKQRISSMRRKAMLRYHKEKRRQARRKAEYEKYLSEFKHKVWKYRKMLGRRQADQIFVDINPYPNITSYFAQKTALLNERKLGKLHFKNARARLIASQMGDVMTTNQARTTFNAMKKEGLIPQDAKFNELAMIELRTGVFKGEEEWFNKIRSKRKELFEKYANDPYAKKKVREEIAKTMYES